MYWNPRSALSALELLVQRMLLGLCLLTFSDWAVALSFEERLGNWVHQNMLSGFEERQFSAAGLTVVRGDELLLGATFGIQSADPVQLAHPQRTRFRISSITKVMIAVAILQLLESEHIGSLRDPVNRYLKRWQLPKNQGREITLHHLLTHSAGFDYSSFGIYAPREGKDSSATELEVMLPPYVRPVDEWAVYSNYGGALLGVLVEDLTGQSMEIYLRENLFTPLGMSETELRRNVSSNHLAVPYQSIRPNEMRPLSVSAYSSLMSLSMGVETTVQDMGRFLSFLLTGEGAAGQQVLEKSALERMRKERFSNHAAASGFGMILDVVQQTPDLTLFMHNGATPGFSSHLTFLPQLNLGLFVSVVGEPGDSASGPIRNFQSAPQLTASFIRELVLPYEFAGTGEGPVGELSGHYLSDKRPISSPEAVFDVVREPMYRRVVQSSGAYESNDRPAREIATNVFWFPGPYAYREMFRWRNGQPHMVIYGSMVLSRIQAWLLPGNLVSLASISAVLLSLLPLVSINAINRKEARGLLICGLAIPVLVLAIPLYVIVTPQGVAGIYDEFQHMNRSGIMPLLWLAHLLLLVLGIWLLLVWRRRRELMAGTLEGSVLAMLVLIVSLERLNILGEGTQWLL